MILLSYSIFSCCYGRTYTMPQNPNQKIKITISYGYDIHNLELSENDYEKIKDGETLEIEGQGFSIEGDVIQDTWHFNAGRIDISCENGFQVFQGTLEDIIDVTRI
jgi:hypothetical protein